MFKALHQYGYDVFDIPKLTFQEIEMILLKDKKELMTMKKQQDEIRNKMLARRLLN